MERVGRAGLITLTRPKALNALSKAMLFEMGEALDEWAADDRVERVLIRGEGKAFCAGGDIRYLYSARSDGLDFFTTEYRHNARVKHFPKPYVSLLDGIVMGGGVGISAHGSHRVASENVVFAMPEVGIGLFPDVGASHILSELEGAFGLYLALTGTRVARDAGSQQGLFTHPVDHDRLGDCLDRAVHGRDLDGALDELKSETEPQNEDDLALIARCFAAASVSEIMDRLGDEDAPLAQEARDAIAGKSPTSLKVTFEEITRAKGLSFDECITTEYRIVAQVLEGHDLYEGIRATVIDKDRNPQWSPATLDGVDDEVVAAHFDEPEVGDLSLPVPAAETAS